VPSDSARQRLTVDTLRTWRPSDERWIESQGTAVVETLPFALDRTVDYSHIRETMLLHDGIELPCVVETAYTISDIEPFRAGMDGRFDFAGEDPRIIARLILAAPSADDFTYSPGGGANQPTIASSAELEQLVFTMGPVEPAPPGVHAVDDLPHVRWSTWPGWGAMGESLLARVDDAEVLGEELRDALDDTLESARTPAERVERVATLVDESTRSVHFDWRWFAVTRTASRTWATAYGHDLDRAALAVALLRAAGFEATPLLVAPAGRAVPPAVAGLADFDTVMVSVDGERFEGAVDLESGTLLVGPAPLPGRVSWRPGVDPAPHETWPGDGTTSRAVLRFDLQHGDDGWAGTAMLDADGVLNPFHLMRGLEPKRSLEALAKIIDAVVPGATVGACNPDAFGPSRVTVGASVGIPVGASDPQGRLRLELGSPAAALGAPLAGDPDLQRLTRRGSIILPGPVSERLEVHVALGELEAVDLPSPVTMSNRAGTYTLRIDRSESGIDLIREVELSRQSYPAELWPELRQLLLAVHQPAHRRLLLRP
jgi:hypothetical protein